MNTKTTNAYMFMIESARKIHDLIDRIEPNDRSSIIEVLDEMTVTLNLILQNIKQIEDVTSVTDSEEKKVEKEEEFNLLRIQIDEFCESLENDFKQLSIDEDFSFKKKFQHKVLDHLERIDKKAASPRTTPDSLYRQIEFLYETVQGYKTEVLNLNDRDFLANIEEHQGVLLSILMVFMGVGFAISPFPSCRVDGSQARTPDSITVIGNKSNLDNPNTVTLPNDEKVVIEIPRDSTEDKLCSLLGSGIFGVGLQNLNEELKARNKRRES